MRVAAYRNHARQCLELVQRCEDAQTRAVLLGIAQSWLRLAEQVTAEVDWSRAEDAATRRTG